jgi:hypothetical protein
MAPIWFEFPFTASQTADRKRAEGRTPMALAAAEDLNRLRRERLAGFGCPRAYEFLADIGRNAMGQINRREPPRRCWPSERTIGG